MISLFYSQSIEAVAVDVSCCRLQHNGGDEHEGGLLYEAFMSTADTEVPVSDA